MNKMRWLTIITLLVLLFPSQGALAHNRAVIPTIGATPFTTTTPINTTVTYHVSLTNLPNYGLHCVNVVLAVPAGYKVYPGTGYSYYHIFTPTTLDFKVKVPNTAQRKFFTARVSWSRDYICRSMRATRSSPLVEVIVTK